jgi:hypothetical protein
VPDIFIPNTLFKNKCLEDRKRLPKRVIKNASDLFSYKIGSMRWISYKKVVSGYCEYG